MKKIYLTLAALLTVTGLQAESTTFSSSITKDGITYDLNQYDSKDGVPTVFSRDLVEFTMDKGTGTATLKYNTTQTRTDVFYCNAIPTAVDNNKINVDLSDFKYTESGFIETEGDLTTTTSYQFSSDEYIENRATAWTNYARFYPFLMTWGIATQDEEKLKTQYGENNCEFEWVWYDPNEKKASKRLKYFDSYTEMCDAGYSGGLVGYWRETQIDTTNNYYYITYFAIEYIAVAEQTITTVTNNYECQVTQILKNGAFENKSNLQSITISKNTWNIAPGAFQGSSNLNSFTLMPGGDFVYSNGIIYDENKTTIIAATSTVPSQEIPETVESIANYAFYNTAAPITLTSMNGDLQVGNNQNNITIYNPSKTLGLETLPKGGYKVTGNVTQSNFNALTIPAGFHYVDCTEATILENITVNNNSNGIYYFTTDKTVTGENVVNNSVCAYLHIYDTKDEFYIPTEFTADSAIYDRHFSTNWATMCLPFSVSEDENVDMYFGALKSYGWGQFTFTYATSVLAYKPYVVRSKESEDLQIRVKNAHVPATHVNNTVASSAKFVGVLKPTQVTSASDTTYYGVKDCKFVKILGATVNTFRAYLSVPTSELDAATLRFVDAMDQEIETVEMENTTGIVNINAKEVNDVVYDINGQRKATATRGLNIVNGKVNIIK